MSCATHPSIAMPDWSPVRWCVPSPCNRHSREMPWRCYVVVSSLRNHSVGDTSSNSGDLCNKFVRVVTKETAIMIDINAFLFQVLTCNPSHCQKHVWLFSRLLLLLLLPSSLLWVVWWCFWNFDLDMYKYILYSYLLNNMGLLTPYAREMDLVTWLIQFTMISSDKAIPSSQNIYL